ncbi:MAG: DsrE family protein [candidate division KSB1 bacterium]|nr:DsrE family protein [candidate division KSB1 bacterium]MDZ7274076.1 DsrE family protein [candidate division KSB1 bacterium]MDZ7287878.1 DsrE family protein [candidate division KSB1 bacterium]MDZ7296676.1 DsrE family protein [candidate division KSB1 bacterium]MDZ7307293.1 DsrE family protein [candidate division KSB1 bacterium]
MIDGEGKKILVIQTHGVETPRRTYSPLFYAMAAAAMEMDVMVWFTMDGTNQLKKGAAEKVQLDPTSDVTLKTMLEQAMESGVKLRVCQQSMALWKMQKEDLIPGVEILGATSIIDLALEADHVMYF